MPRTMTVRWTALTWVALAACRAAPEPGAQEPSAAASGALGSAPTAVAVAPHARGTATADPVAGPAPGPRPADSAGKDGVGPDGPGSESAELSDATFTGTAGILEQKRETHPRLLTAVRFARHAHYDRAVFEFAEGVPGYHVEYIDRPVRDCGAGDTKDIEGDGWLEVRFYPANAHTEAGQPTVAQRELWPRLPIVREVERTCDFEAVVTWVLGTASPNRYRVLELESPPRFVVDILH